MTEQLRLVNCPFCDKHSGIYDDGASHDDIGCSDPDCPGAGALVHYHGDGPDELAKLVELYNSRPSPWVPVSERLPPDCVEVYIWPRPDYGVDVHTGEFLRGNWTVQVYDSCGVFTHSVNVTHWMPLPAAPKGE